MIVIDIKEFKTKLKKLETLIITAKKIDLVMTIIKIEIK